MITHIVVMKLTDPADAAGAKERLESLVGRVPQIRSLAVGIDEGGATGHHLALTTTHDDLDELKGYQSHPAHLEVAGWLRERLAERCVVDYTA